VPLGAEFLEIEHNSENLCVGFAPQCVALTQSWPANRYFWEEVETLRATKHGGKRPAADLLLLPEQVRADDTAWVGSIQDTFIKDEAPQSINVSHQQRKALLVNIDAALASKQVSPEIFNDAQNEVKRLMLQDAWPRFMVRMTTEKCVCPAQDASSTHNAKRPR